MPSLRSSAALPALCLLAAAAAAAPRARLGDLSDCGSPGFTFGTMAIFPDPPLPGAAASLNASGTLTAAVSGGNISVTVLYYGVGLFAGSASTCGNTTIELPLDAGQIDVWGFQNCPATANSQQTINMTASASARPALASARPAHALPLLARAPLPLTALPPPPLSASRTPLARAAPRRSRCRPSRRRARTRCVRERIGRVRERVRESSPKRIRKRARARARACSPALRAPRRRRTASGIITPPHPYSRGRNS
jgi:hypothetical protein